MGDYDFKPSEMINAREAFIPIIRPKVETIDKVVSEIVGKPIKTTNPTLIKLVTKWKKIKGDSDEPDNLLKNPEFIKELKIAL